MITELYYGDFEIQIDTRLKKEFMAALKETDLELKSTLMKKLLFIPLVMSRFPLLCGWSV